METKEEVIKIKEERIKKQKLFERIKKLKTDDSEIKIAQETYISFHSKDIKKLKIEEEELILTLFDKLSNSLFNFQIVKKRLLRLFFVSEIEKSFNKKKEINEKENEIKHMSDIDPTIPVYTTKESINYLIFNQRKTEKLRNERQQEIIKQKKMKDLLDICEALSSVQSKKNEIELLLREKILQIIDAFVMQYGGVAFLAPLNIATNASLGANLNQKHWEEIEFLEYVWSTSTSSLVQEMNSFGLNSPKLTKSPLFRQILLSKKPVFIQGDSVKLPDNHFTIENALLIPIVVNKSSVGLLGMANGNFSSIDLEIIFEILPRMWQTIILESVSRANKRQEDVERLKSIEKRVEYGKKLTLGLSNVLKHEDNESEEEITSMSKNKLLKKKLSDIANFLEDRFGGMIFIGAIKVEMNVNLLKIGSDSNTSSSGSDIEKDVDNEKFMAYVFSNSAEAIRKSSMKDERKPYLKNSKTMQSVCKSQKPTLFSDTSTFKLPNSHFPMSSVLLVPVVINSEVVALCGLSNGKYTQLDGEILSDVLSTLWFTILQECFSRIDLRYKEKLNAKKNATNKLKESFGLPKRIQNKLYESVTIVTFQFSLFNEMTKKIVPNDLIEFLTYSFSKFDLCVSQFRLQKLSTFLDEYIVIGGLSESKYDFEISCSNFVFSILDEVEKLNKEKDLPEEILKFFPLTLNIGISTGSCIGGYINCDQDEDLSSENNYNIFGESLDISKELKNNNINFK
eukprot:gene10560-3079_t